MTTSSRSRFYDQFKGKLLRFFSITPFRLYVVGEVVTGSTYENEVDALVLDILHAYENQNPRVIFLDKTGKVMRMVVTGKELVDAQEVKPCP